MAVYTVHLYFIGGGSHQMEVQADTFSQVSMSITHNRDGWFGKQGDLIQLRNVERVQIAESDEGRPRTGRF